MDVANMAVTIVLRTFCVITGILAVSAGGAILRVLEHYKVYPFNKENFVLCKVYSDMGKMFLKNKNSGAAILFGILQCLLATFGATAIFVIVAILMAFTKLVVFLAKHICTVILFVLMNLSNALWVVSRKGYTAIKYKQS